MSSKLYEFTAPIGGAVKLEESADKRDLFMSGIFIQGDVRNHNQRIYPKHEILHAVNDVKKIISEGKSILGQLDHPEELTIDLDRVSHIIEDMWMQGADGYGKLKLVGTPVGNIAKALLQSGVKLGVSSRGSGDVDDNGYVSNFEIVTVDIVATPSAPNAYPKAIYESLYNMKGGQQLSKLAKESIHDVKAYQALGKEIKRFINELKI